jgi:hypothetical protein
VVDKVDPPPDTGTGQGGGADRARTNAPRRNGAPPIPSGRKLHRVDTENMIGHNLRS